MAQVAMTAQANKPTRISSTDLQRKIGEISRQAAKNGVHFIVERDGFPVLAVISATEYRLLLQDRAHLLTLLQGGTPQAGAAANSTGTKDAAD